MKTKITSFLTAAVLSVLALANSSFAEAESGFYDKDHIRGFVSFGTDFRIMHDDFQSYVNHLAFVKGGHTVSTDEGDVFYSGGKMKYKTFDDYYLGLHAIFGAQYKQFQTWIDVNFMPTQISERPSNTYTAEAYDANGDVLHMKFPLYDVKWYSYGADWMFGWKLFGENTFINLIPAVGFGFNLINIHFASNFEVTDLNGGETYNFRNRYYSAMATTVNSELEGRLEFDHLALGVYVGYRFVRYNELSVEGKELVNTEYIGDDTDNNGDTFFLGLRLTWIFHSDWQTKQENKL
ncbi:hypothetical protein [Fibrobacter sp. UWH3]|uniref:hypothetical protein n=1 Tax=Fibrobacter sp. UWH3 TaxID=1964353 RepID=UPI000B526D04|nr:hypothetical protein [Fibrobacter sp. UWH3]OWV04122.1 hypothetical protein B7993_11885 [Fibrobacter sp. UWH3]